jgi:hypothetical protein
LILTGVIIPFGVHYKATHSPHSDKVAPTKEQLKDYVRAHYAGDEIQFECFDALLTMESHWNYQAKGDRTRLGRAYGIPQALPANKMAVSGHDYLTNPYTQLRWVIRYINTRYGGKACRALRWHLNQGWY